MHACYVGWGHMLPGENYETLVLLAIHFVLKIFKYIDFYIKTRCTQGVLVFFLQSKKVI